MLLLSWIADFETKFSEAKLRYVDLKELHVLHDISPSGYYTCKIIDAMEREYFKT